MVTPALRAASRCLIRPFIHSSSNFTFSSRDISAISFSLLPSSFISVSLLLGAYQTVILKDCNIDSALLAKFDADAEYLDEDMDFTFEDFKMPEAFKDLEGFLTN